MGGFKAPLQSVGRPAYCTRSTAVRASVFDEGTAKFAAEFPWLAKYGFGPSVKAERWNGRHAMFGWFFILMTGYAKTHGLFPDAGVALKYNDWGGLAQLRFGEYISNERAIIMIAHIHALAVSAAAAFGPQVLGDSLTLQPGETDEEPYGLFPPLAGRAALLLPQRCGMAASPCLGLSWWFCAVRSLARTSSRSSTLALAVCSPPSEMRDHFYTLPLYWLSELVVAEVIRFFFEARSAWFINLNAVSITLSAFSYSGTIWATARHQAAPS